MIRKTGLSRRRFMALAGVAAAECAAGAMGLSAFSARHVPGANGTIRIGLIGCGNRGLRLLHNLVKRSRSGHRVRLTAVCDVWERRRRQAAYESGAEVSRRWQRLVERPDIDAVIIATPDHWHAPMAVAAIQSGKDVYCEAPMALTVGDARAFRDCAAASSRIVQIGCERVSQGRWRKANAVVGSGALGRILWSQDSCNSGIPRSASSVADTGPLADLDWQAFLGHTPSTPFDPHRYFSWRSYWDYSSGTAVNLLFERLASLLAAVGPKFPERVSAAGGVYASRCSETPDALVMTAEYPGNLTIVLASSAVVKEDLPPVIRGQRATLYCDRNKLTVVAEPDHDPAGGGRCTSRKTAEIRLEPSLDHMSNWLECLRSRKRCACDEELGYRATVAIAMAVDAYRRGATLFFDRVRHEVMVSPPRIIQWA